MYNEVQLKTVVLFILMLMAGVPALAGAKECLQIGEYEIKTPSDEFGIVEIEWQAQIKNACDTELYATVTLSFNANDGETLKESFTSITVEKNKTVSVTKKAMFTGNTYDDVAETEIVVTGKEL